MDDWSRRHALHCMEESSEHSYFKSTTIYKQMQPMQVSHVIKKQTSDAH